MSGTKYILVIDRDKLVCRIIKLFLENTGKYRVTYSTDIAKGIKSRMSKRIELILFDDRFPQFDGLHLSDHVRSNMKRPVPLLPTGAVIDRSRLKMPHIDLNTIINGTILKRIDELVKSLHD